jgi:hypothetical protein
MYACMYNLRMHVQSTHAQLRLGVKLWLQFPMVNTSLGINILQLYRVVLLWKKDGTRLI